MAQILPALLLTSGMGTALALLLTLLRPITRRGFSAAWHYYMWLIVLLVMILPIRFSLPEKAAPPASAVASIAEDQEEGNAAPLIATQREPITQEQTHAELPAQSEKPIQPLKDFLSGKTLLLSFLWLGGALLSFLSKLVGYLVFLVKIQKHSLPIACPEIKLYTNRKVKTMVCDTICSPLMIGVVRPTLWLPKRQFTPEQLQNILAHEMTHLKRNDILYKWFVSLVKCVHWFNPAIYWISEQINLDCEISCDLAVVAKMNKQQEKAYIETILSLLTQSRAKPIPLSTGMAGSKEALKRRFLMIKNQIKISKKAAVISGILAIAVFAAAIFASGAVHGRLFKPYENPLLAVDTDPVTGDDFNLLFVGLDRNDRADTLLLFSLQESGMQALSIPRDSLLDGKRASEILAAENGDQTLIDAIKTTLSVPIQYYAKMNLSAVQEIVDHLGGVEFAVPMDMLYDDPYQDLRIDLKEGVQTLDGEMACQLLQFRQGYPQGDLSRIQLQQQFLQELLRQKLNGENLAKAPEILQTISANVETNYPIGRLKQDAKLLRAVSGNIVLETLADGATVSSS